VKQSKARAVSVLCVAISTFVFMPTAIATDPVRECPDGFKASERSDANGGGASSVYHTQARAIFLRLINGALE
jgi:hypothetical protein